MPLPAEAAQADALPSCCSSHTVNRCPVLGLFSAIFHLFVLFVYDFATEMAPSVVLKCCLLF